MVKEKQAHKVQVAKQIPPICTYGCLLVCRYFMHLKCAVHAKNVRKTGILAGNLAFKAEVSTDLGPAESCDRYKII